MAGVRPTKEIPDRYIGGDARQITIGVNEEQEAQGTEAVEAIVEKVKGGALDGMPATSVRLELEPGDLEELQENPHLWLTFLGTSGTILPFMVQTERSVENAGA